MRVSTIAIISSLIALALFAGFTIYGNKVGNFVINVDFKEVRLSLSQYEDLSHQTERLTYNGLSELLSTTYGWIPNDVSKGLGDKSISETRDDKNYSYMAFSFYLINNSDRAVDYVMDLNIIDTVGDPLPMIRVMLIEGDNDTQDDTNRIYALKESTEQDEIHLQEELAGLTPYDTEDFSEEENKVFSVTVQDLGKGESQKYTLVIWLEGCDAQCNDSRMGSRAKMQLDITGY